MVFRSFAKTLKFGCTLGLTMGLLILSIGCNHEVTPGQLAGGPVERNNLQITGTVKLAEGAKLKGQGTLFVIARPKNQVGGPPLAVVRIQNPALPIGFTMSQKSVMIPTNVFEGELRLSAKWSQSGSPMAVSEGDLLTGEDLIVQAGQQNIELLLLANAL